MSSPFLNPRFRAWDSNGLPLAGGILYTYQAGTDTPTPTYADPLFATSNGNSVTLNAYGEALIYSKVQIKGHLKDSSGATISGWPIDNIEFPPYQSYILLGPTVPATPSANVMAIYSVGTTIYTKDSNGTVSSFITSPGIQLQSYTSSDGGGTANAITATFNPPITALTDKLRVSVISTAANTGAVTFAPDAMLAKDLVSYFGTPLIAGQIPGANYPLDMQYMADLDDWVLLNRGTYGAVGKTAILQNRQTQNTDGGTATSGSWLIVPLNTEYEDASSIVDSDALPAFSLAAGTYLIEAEIPFVRSDLSQARLYNVTDAAVQQNLSSLDILGTSGYAYATALVNHVSKIYGTFTIAGTKQFRIEYQVSATQATTGHGEACNFGVEVYAIVRITKI